MSKQTPVARILGRLDESAWLRFVLFIFVPLGILIVSYAVPTISGWLFAFGVADLILLGVYLKAYRPQNLALVVAIIPATIGPLLANLYAEKQLPNGEWLLAQGADVLVQLAFFWAGLISIVFYLLSRSTYGWPERLGWAFTVIVVGFLAVSGSDFAIKAVYDGPSIFWGVHAPPVTGLLVSRVLLAFIAALAAVVGDKEGGSLPTDNSRNTRIK